MPNYNYNSSNELTSNSSGSYTYDANGNTLTDAGGKSYTWDFENRLTQATVPGTGTVAFRYDPFGRRIQKSGPLGITNYLYDWVNPLADVDSTGNFLARYAQGPGIDEPVAQFRSSVTSYYQQDAIRSITSLSTATGAIVNTYGYGSFGKLLASEGSVTNPIQYMGREYDPETGLYEFRNRYYALDYGRFINEDPVNFAGGINFYGFVTNSPVDYTDPFGWMVYKCSRPTTFGGILFWVDWMSRHGGPEHWWIKTDTKEAGLGEAGGGIPGQPGGGYETQTEIVNHAGQSALPGSTCVPQPDEDEDCVNKELNIGEQMGLFLGQSNCHKLVN